MTLLLSSPEDFLYRYRNNPVVAGIAMATQLMRDDPEDFKSGYSLRAAARTVSKLFDDEALYEEIVERLTVGGNDSYEEPIWR